MARLVIKTLAKLSSNTNYKGMFKVVNLVIYLNIIQIRKEDYIKCVE